jgi:hypothetical protein
MNRLALICFAGLAGVATAIVAGEQPPTAAPAATSTSPASPVPPDVIEGARQAKAKRKSGRSRPLTNADVRKSKGNVVINQGAAPAQPPAAEKTVSLEEYREALASRQALELKRDAAKAAVVKLEAALNAVEQSYYDENDLDLRDRVLTARFAEVSTKLDAARLELDAILHLLGETEAPQPSAQPAPENP